MLDSYFFIPANRNDFINKAEKLNATKIVFDLEDSIKREEIFLGIKNLEQIVIKNNYWIRIPSPSFTHLENLISIGFKNFIIPKIRSVNDFEMTLKNFIDEDKFKFIILVENPLLLINLLGFVEKFNDKLEGIGLGSHDYASELNMQHDFENLNFARNQILNIAKAYGIKAIDITSMSIDNKKCLEKEFISSVRLGFDGKFFIHPKQLEIFEKTKFFNENEIEEAIEVLNLVGANSDYSAFKYNGKVFERPHIERLRKIKDWIDGYEEL